ncbi:hypothetical protein BGZ65_009889 [Modicella reniformis]|uniref:Uncharacterized protein n=1 Tax=Modicella reniformis TaxID=1440133 RepID=A0A9P6ISQ6_9FUNG|nr:hypothetical protein BGZ65_009889 [Modicella reniformis]
MHLPKVDDGDSSLPPPKIHVDEQPSKTKRKRRMIADGDTKVDDGDSSFPPAKIHVNDEQPSKTKRKRRTIVDVNAKVDDGDSSLPPAKSHVNDEQPSKTERKRRMIVDENEDEDEDEQKVDDLKHESILARMMAGPLPAKPEPPAIPAPRKMRCTLETAESLRCKICLQLPSTSKESVFLILPTSSTEVCKSAGKRNLMDIMVPWNSWDAFVEYNIEEPQLTKRDWDEIDDLCYEHASPTTRLFQCFVNARKRDWSRIKEAARVRRLKNQAETQDEAQARQVEAWRKKYMNST